MQRRAYGLIALAVCLVSSAVWASTADPLPTEIRRLEAADDFIKARERLAALKATLDNNDVNAHLKLIDNAIDLFGVTDAYEQTGLIQQAIDALTAFLPGVSNARDAYLAMAVQRRIARLQRRLADLKREPGAEQAARDGLTRADTQYARGLYKEALAGYTAVAMSGTSISADLRARANRGVAKAAQSDFDSQPFGMVATVHRTLGNAATTVGHWFFTAAVLLPLLALLWVGRRLWLTNTRTLELADHTQVPPSPSANRELAQQLEDVLERIRLADRGAAKLEATESNDVGSGNEGDLPPPDLVFLTTSSDVPELASELEKFVSTAPAVQVGPIGLNPQLLWNFARRLFTRRARHAFAGGLVSYDGTLVLRVTREDRFLGTRVEWRASAPSTLPAARIACLVDVACRIILDSRHVVKPTENFDSLKAYVLGLYALSENTSTALDAAAACFQDALNHDDDNWLARFQLGVVDRSRKKARSAIRHLMWFEGPLAATSGSLQQHVAAHPDFPHVVKYHLASTLAMRGDARDDQQVVDMLDELSDLEDSTAGECLDARRRFRLVMLARSAQCTREAVRSSRLRNDAAGREPLAAARQRLATHLKWFDDQAQELERAAPSGHSLARGIVLYAYGRLQYASGHSNNAVASLTEAVDLLPDYADVCVDLAKVYLERKSDTNWPQRVTTLLDRALTLDDKNAKAQFVYARFYMSDGARDFAKAESYLSAAPFDSASLFMYAQILSRRDQHAQALDVLERAIALQPKGPTTFRIRMYAESLHALVIADPKARMLERARRRLCQYDSLFEPEERDTKNYERVVAIYKDICARMNVKAHEAKCFQDQLQATPVTDSERRSLT